MAEKDTVTKEYMQDKENFADAFNFFLYDGEQIIKPEQLRPLDTTSVALPYGEDGRPVPIQKYRDILKAAVAMEDGNAAYLLLGIENQSQINYAMPVRNMLYDALQYVGQVSETTSSHKRRLEKPETGGEFLSGFFKDDKLLPVITLTVYFGAESWDAPRSLHDMIKINDSRLLSYISDYKLNIIVPADIADGDFQKFHTELNLALKYIKYSNNKSELLRAVNEDAAYRSVNKKTVDMLNTLTNSKLSYSDREESVDMCKAIEEIRADGIAEGKAEGKAEGILETLIGLFRDGLISLADAAVRAGMTETEFEQKARS
ncbi:MAG: Rpn family recombination-promoting nuclease/putative transposase [Ruminococcus sp.]|nr:Rpn family recombination-promoting nuclease/putative transposase [Ruminococcus sp.]